MNYLIKCPNVVPNKVEVQVEVYNYIYRMLQTPPSPTPNLHDNAHWIRPATKPGY